MNKQPTVDDLRDDITLTHRDNCTAPAPVVRRGRYGDTLLRCRNCPAFRPIEGWMWITAASLMQAAPEPPSPQKQPTLHEVTVSSWRCRTHLDEPVTWRGTGCRSCAHDHAKNAAKKEAKAKKKEETPS